MYFNTYTIRINTNEIRMASCFMEWYDSPDRVTNSNTLTNCHSLSNDDATEIPSKGQRKLDIIATHRV